MNELGKFQKMGVVRVGTAEEGQALNLLNPIGFPTALEFRLTQGVCVMTVQAQDEINSVVRSYPLQLDAAFAADLKLLFEKHVRRVARDNYNEFKDLIELSDAKNNK